MVVAAVAALEMSLFCRCNGSFATAFVAGTHTNTQKLHEGGSCCLHHQKPYSSKLLILVERRELEALIGTVVNGTGCQKNHYYIGIITANLFGFCIYTEALCDAYFFIATPYFYPKCSRPHLSDKK